MKTISPKEISDEECPKCKSLMFIERFEVVNHSSNKKEEDHHFTCSNPYCNFESWIHIYNLGKKDKKDAKERKDQAW